MFRTFQDVESHLNSLINYEHTFPLGGRRDRPKLQPTLDAAERLGLPLTLSHCLHIAGTVGKGSVAGYLESIMSSRYSTICFTSPHLVSAKERIRINGEIVNDGLWCEGLSEIVDVLEHEPKVKLTYFESTWILFLWLSQRLGMGCHVVETGLGGKWDATNVLTDSTAILTRIDFDHTMILGKTLPEIAADKCGIIKTGSNVVSAPQQDESLNVILQTAAQKKALLHLVGRDFEIGGDLENCTYRDADRTIDGLQIAAPGQFQKENAATAIRAATLVDPSLSALEMYEAARRFVPQARQQLMPGIPPVLLDTAHNPASFRVLADSLRTRFSDRRITAVIGMMKDKDARSSFAHLRGLLDNVIIVSVGNPRSYGVEELTTIVAEAGLQPFACPNIKEAFEQLHDERKTEFGLVTGSFYVAGDYLKWRQDAGIA